MILRVFPSKSTLEDLGSRESAAPNIGGSDLKGVGLLGVAGTRQTVRATN